MKKLHRLLAWLRREEYVRAVVAEAVKLAYLEGQKEGSSAGYLVGYQVGRAHGELIGRENLASELQIYGAMEPEELATLKARQLH